MAKASGTKHFYTMYIHKGVVTSWPKNSPIYSLTVPVLYSGTITTYLTQSKYIHTHVLYNTPLPYKGYERPPHMSPHEHTCNRSGNG